MRAAETATLYIQGMGLIGGVLYFPFLENGDSDGFTWIAFSTKGMLKSEHWFGRAHQELKLGLLIDHEFRSLPCSCHAFL